MPRAKYEPLNKNPIITIVCPETGELVEAKEITNLRDYFACKNGRIYSGRTYKYIKGHNNGIGYMVQRFEFDDGTFGYKLFHRLIALAWCDRPNDECIECNHKDFDKQNNEPENLEWTTRHKNMQHAADSPNWKNNLTGFNWHTKTPEEKEAWSLRKSRELKEWWASLTPEQIAEQKASRSKGLKRHWKKATPAQRAEHGARLSEALKRPEVIQKMKAAQKRLAGSPARRATISARLKNYWAAIPQGERGKQWTPEKRQAQSQAMKDYWAKRKGV